MTVDLNEHKVKFWFEYVPAPELNAMRIYPKDYVHPGDRTICHCEYDDVAQASASITRYFKDPSNRPLARRTALSLFLARGRWSREERSAIWAEYFRQHSDLRRKNNAAVAPKDQRGVVCP